MMQGNNQQGSTAKVIVEPRNSQAGSLEDRFEGFRLQNALAMVGSGDAMSQAIINSQIQATHGFLLDRTPRILPTEVPGRSLSRRSGRGGVLHSDIECFNAL
jgi:hypothetical protein